MNNNDNGLDLVCEAYLTQRLYSSRVPLSDGFVASLTKEFKTLKSEGYSVDRILKKIMFELKKMDENSPKNAKPAKMDADVNLPEKAFKDVLRPVDRGI